MRRRRRRWRWRNRKASDIVYKPSLWGERKHTINLDAYYKLVLLEYDVMDYVSVSCIVSPGVRMWESKYNTTLCWLFVSLNEMTCCWTGQFLSTQRTLLLWKRQDCVRFVCRWLSGGFIALWMLFLYAYFHNNFFFPFKLVKEFIHGLFHFLK